MFFIVIRDDPSRSESIRVDPTRTGGLSWSGPTFVPASSFGYASGHQAVDEVPKNNLINFGFARFRWNFNMMKLEY